MKITIHTRKSSALSEWLRKEEGSYEDFKYFKTSGIHVYALLERFGGKVTLTEEEAKTLVKSGEYQSTAWQPEEIAGGVTTMRIIAGYVEKIKQQLRYITGTPEELSTLPN